MSYAPRQSIFPNSVSSTTSSLRQPILGSSNAQSQQSSALQARIASKRQELENLKQLRDLSGALANQIGALEAKLATLRDGTEAVACVLANWDNVLRAISMASSMFTQRGLIFATTNPCRSESSAATPC
jgi:DASH complex subunit DAD2